MSATEIISEGPEGIILESVLEGYAEYYSADLSEKVIRGMTENALKGKFTGGAIPFGYTINADRRFEIDPLTAPFVAETFQRYNDGQTMREIRDWLNEKGIKNQRGGPMTFNTIQHMLSNRRYIGELKYRDILIPDAIPSIVTTELFNDVQEKMLKNKKAPARRKAEDDYLLTTKLHCGYCGALMFGESGTSRTGEVHRCSSPFGNTLQRIRGLAAELTAACEQRLPPAGGRWRSQKGEHREARLGPLTDFSKPAQGL